MNECCRKTQNEMFKQLGMVIDLRMGVLESRISDLAPIPDDEMTQEQKADFVAFTCFRQELKAVKVLLSIEGEKVKKKRRIFAKRQSKKEIKKDE